MKEKIQNKIEALIVYILSKPVVRLTSEDYSILSSELNQMLQREGAEARNKRLRELMDASFVSDR